MPTPYNTWPSQAQPSKPSAELKSASVAGPDVMAGGPQPSLGVTYDQLMRRLRRR